MDKRITKPEHTFGIDSRGTKHAVRKTKLLLTSFLFANDFCLCSDIGTLVDALLLYSELSVSNVTRLTFLCRSFNCFSP